MKLAFYYISLLFIIVQPAHASWQRSIVNYERNTYAGSSQNWMIKQDLDNGRMFFANSAGLLEFDGSNWAIYKTNNEIVRCIEIKGNRIYVGGTSDFGYFEPNEIGILIYHSLTDYIPDWKGEVWNIIINNDLVYFIAEGNILIYDQKDKVKVIEAGVKIDASILIGETICIGSPDGIFFLNSRNQLKPITNDENIKNEKIVGLETYQGKLLITTARNGLYLSGKGKIEKLNLPAADSFIRNSQLFSSALKGSSLAIGSVQNGLLMIDLENPSVKEEYNLLNGLPNSTILSTLFDRDGNLWLGLDRGISYLNIESPIRPLFSTNSPIGTGYCSAIYNGELYLGTNQGLYRLDKNNNYHFIKDSEGQIWSLNIYDNTLFCSGDSKILVINHNSISQIPLSGIWEILPMQSSPNHLIASAYSGFRILEKKNGQWSFRNNVENYFKSSRGFIEDEPNVFWVASQPNIVLKVQIDKNHKEVISSREYILSNATIGVNTTFRKVDNNPTICTKNGIFKYSRMTDSFVPYSELEDMLEGREYYDFLYLDNKENIWFVVDKNMKVLAPNKDNNKLQIYNLGLSDDLIQGYQNVTTIDSTSTILSVDNGFVRINMDDKIKKASPTLKVAIRKIVATNQDSIIFYDRARHSASIPYSLNSISIFFATPEYSNIDNIVYSYRLKGVNEHWSLPTSKNFKEYTNLPEGKYTFEVKAFRKGESGSDNISSLVIEILPPWYRSVWAYLFYSLLLLIGLYYLYKSIIAKQQHIIDEKGKELIAQSERHEQESQQKDKEIYELQNENLKTTLFYKTQELSGYILNLVQKNEMLEDVKKSAMGISRSIDENKQSAIIKQKVVNLISKINNSIEHDKDFEVFQSNFNVIHSDFFNSLDKMYSNLTRNDKILCAYLKMNLSSKEIAPLLNISIRGVEVSRYRLRKKLNLDTEVNLSDYLNNLK